MIRIMHDGMTTLMAASAGGHSGCPAILLLHNADINDKTVLVGQPSVISVTGSSQQKVFSVVWTKGVRPTILHN